MIYEDAIALVVQRYAGWDIVTLTPVKKNGGWQPNKRCVVTIQGALQRASEHKLPIVTADMVKEGLDKWLKS